MTNNEKLDPGHWIGIMLIILALLYLCATRSCAQTKQTTRIDTVECHNGCIVKFNMATTAKGNPKYSAVYNCTHNAETRKKLGAITRQRFLNKNN